MGGSGVRIDDAAVQRLVAGLVARKGIRHALLAMAVGTEAVPRVFVAGVAAPDGHPMGPNTPFFIASVTKLFISTAVLQLVERGLVRLDAPIGEYLPAALTEGLHRHRGRDHDERLTVEHLLRHMSGLPDWLEGRPKGGRPLIDELFEGGDRTFAIEDIVAIVRDRLAPHFPPQDLGKRRARVRYSDTNYQLLMAIIEAVTGLPLHEVYRDRIFRPLGLRHTWLPGHEPLAPTEAPATVYAGDRPLALPLTMASARDLYGTGGDLVAFLRALTSGAAFDDPATGRRLQDHWRHFGVFLDPSAMSQPRWPIQYGMGMMRLELPWFLDPRRRVPAFVGHTGSTGTWAFFVPALDIYLAGTVDQATAAPLPFSFIPQLLRRITA